MKKRILGILAAGSIIWTSWAYGTNYLRHHNKVDEFRGVREVSKMDGMNGHTELTFKDGWVEEVNRYSFLGESIIYNDFDGDGAVDYVHIMPPGKMSRVYFLEKHLEESPEVFANAQRDFDEQIERFQDLIN